MLINKTIIEVFKRNYKFQEVDMNYNYGPTHMTLGGDTESSKPSRLMFSIKIPGDMKFVIW